jgi:hypothetical protein
VVEADGVVEEPPREEGAEVIIRGIFANKISLALIKSYLLINIT